MIGENRVFEFCFIEKKELWEVCVVWLYDNFDDDVDWMYDVKVKIVEVCCIWVECLIDNYWLGYFWCIVIVGV